MVRRIALAAVCAVGCLGSKTTVCENGAICPDGLACTETTPIVCGDEANVTACSGLPDHTACSTSLEPMGACTSGVCGACSPELVECRYDGWIAMPSHTDKQLDAIWAMAPNEVYAVGVEGTVLYYDGVEWKPAGPLGTSSLSGVWSSSPTDVYATSTNDALVYHYDGATWTSKSETTLFGIWGSRADDIFAVGLGGMILHYDGSWTQQANTPPTLNSVWGASATNVLAVGNSGTVKHFNGSSWQAAPAIGTTTAILFGVWTAATGQGFVVGADGAMGMVAVQDNATWNRQAVPSVLRGVFGVAENNVFAAGDGGTIMHFAGATWTPMTSPTQNTLYAVGGAGGEVFAVGSAGTILRYSVK